MLQWDPSDLVLTGCTEHLAGETSRETQLAASRVKGHEGCIGFGDRSAGTTGLRVTELQRMTPSSLRRLQWLAIVGAIMMLGWNGSPLSPSQESDGAAFAAVADPTPLPVRLERAGIVDVLNRRNPALGPEKADRIADAVLRCTSQQNLDELTPRLVLSVMFQESDARPHAISPKGAVGLMQVMPYMFELLQLPGGLAHLETNVEAGCVILADNIRRLGRERGISAYFWGSNIRGDDYLNGVETILRTLSPATPALTETAERG